LFLSKTQLVPMPLEATYLRAWTGEPRRWQRQIDTATSEVELAIEAN